MILNKYIYSDEYDNKNSDEYDNDLNFYYHDKYHSKLKRLPYNNDQFLNIKTKRSIIINIDRFYYNLIKNDKQFFSNRDVDSSKHREFTQAINNAFFLFTRRGKQNNLILSIYDQWNKYGNISEKQLLVLSKNVNLDINLNKYYTFDQFTVLYQKEKKRIELENLKQRKKEIRMEKIKNKMIKEILEDDINRGCASIILKYYLSLYYQ